MTPEAAWITFAICLLIAGLTILITGLRKHDGKEPDSATTWQPAPDEAHYREFHNMNRAEWERKSHAERARLRDQFHRARRL